MAFIDGTVVNVAIPAMQASLHANVSGAQWIVESYALLLSALLLVGGSMGDLYGRRKVFVWGVFLFALGSAWCGFARSIDALILARGLQGVGGALLIPGSLALISASFSSSERGKAIGTWSGFTAITTAIGPVLGGWLVDHRSWRGVFFVNVPIAAVVVLLALWRVPESHNEVAGKKLDWPGAALAAIGLCSITFAFIQAPGGGIAVTLAAVTGVVSVIAFLLVEVRSSSPMVSPKLFDSREFTAANLITFFLYAAFGGMLFFLPLDLIQVQHYSATAAGLSLLPLILIIFLLSRWSGGLLVRYGARVPLVVGSALAGLGFALFLRIGSSGSYWVALFPGVVVLGLGMAVSVAPLTTTVMNAVPSGEAGTASGVNNAVSRVAGLMAVAIFGLILYTSFNTHLDRELKGLALSPAQRLQVEQQRPRLAAAETSDPRVRLALDRAFSSGFRAVLLAAIGCATTAALVGFLMLDKTPPPQH
jgi:EmrB/QacA subfamily drug resistance transporter